jgi:hypothetical protein
MKKSFILCFLLVLSACAYGQGNKKFKFGLSINPSISNNLLSNNGNVPSEVASFFRSIYTTVFRNK